MRDGGAHQRFAETLSPVCSRYHNVIDERTDAARDAIDHEAGHADNAPLGADDEKRYGRIGEDGVEISLSEGSGVGREFGQHCCDVAGIRRIGGRSTGWGQ